MDFRSSGGSKTPRGPSNTGKTGAPWLVLLFRLFVPPLRVESEMRTPTRFFITFLGTFLSVWLVAVLFGASLTTDIRETAGLALWVASLSCFPVLLLLRSNFSLAFLLRPDLVPALLFLPQRDIVVPLSLSHRISALLYLGTMLGTWFGACAIPLDWDRWWQLPVPPCQEGLIYVREAVAEIDVQKSLRRTQPVQSLHGAPWSHQAHNSCTCAPTLGTSPEPLRTPGTPWWPATTLIRQASTGSGHHPDASTKTARWPNTSWPRPKFACHMQILDPRCDKDGMAVK
ncbi:hypothetical protein PAPYR_710 [Paratrimastix pyriformis]|uniref:Uncharacterized protein n=1 Tax=Paratrimastix pyriformis TaxID=342808 RepID=A0ABQ8UV04_9EUKA|nr:hypothetical protein PAPYR_710 [Paratrimastix pyriformis]